MKLVDDFRNYAKKRGGELQDLASTKVFLTEMTARVAGQQFKFRVNVERASAWELYVELSTRVATQPFEQHYGLLRESLSSLHALFSVTRRILREAGPEVALQEESLGKYAMALLNIVIRPYLAKWHPLLATWETKKGPESSAHEHESSWPQIEEARAELANLQQILRGYSDALAILAGIEEDGSAR